MEWVRGEIIGRGSFSTINLATPRRNSTKIPSLMAVKSTLLSQSSMLQEERRILSQLAECSQIVHCFGDDVTVENGEEVYNVFLELAGRGDLAQVMKKSGGSMKERDVRRYTRLILQGLCYIHETGYVHCDIKPQNILVCSSSDGETDIKVADFGLAKRAGDTKNSVNTVLGLIGTPLYMSPEAISQGEHEAPSDVWALGCIVVEMITGRPAWKYQIGADVSSLLFRIGFGDELPEIPEELCQGGKDFLRRCFVRDPAKRWTAEMLLNHPFVSDNTVSLEELEEAFSSPRSPFDFPDWTSEQSSILSSIEAKLDQLDCLSSHSGFLVMPCDRFLKLTLGNQPNWSCSEGWITVREAESPVLSKEEKNIQNSQRQILYGPDFI